MTGDPVNHNDPGGLTTCDENGNNCFDGVTVNGDTGDATWFDDPSDYDDYLDYSGSLNPSEVTSCMADPACYMAHMQGTTGLTQQQVQQCVSNVNSQVAAVTQSVDNWIMSSTPFSSSTLAGLKALLFGMEQGANGAFADMALTAAGGAAFGAMTGFVLGFGASAILGPVLDPIEKQVFMALVNNLLSALASTATQNCQGWAGPQF